MGVPQTHHEVVQQYRAVKDLPDALLEHATVCIEEGLYSQAFSLLASSLTAGTGTTRSAHVPPGQHVALSATLGVHPSMTTRTLSKDKHEAANGALQYLTHLLRLAGVQNARLATAFHFDRSGDARANRARYRGSLPSLDEQAGSLRCVYAEKESLWSRCEDFWHLLGWALNCSVVHKHRWERWKLLLDIMLDAMENDLVETMAQHGLSEDGSSAESALDNTLLVRYIGTRDAARDTRRVMRAIFADGSAKPMAQFGQVWTNETAEPKRSTASAERKRRKLDIERGDYGDYDVDSDDELAATAQFKFEEGTPASSMVAPAPEPADGSLGDVDAIKIRQRMLAILVRLCIAQPGQFLDVEELFSQFAEFMRPLPVTQFQRLVLGLGSLIDDDSQSSLYQTLLRHSIDAAAPVYNRNELTQEDFETHFAPYAANSTSVSENAKVSLLVEGLLRLLWKADLITYTDDLGKHVVRGITARHEKVDGRRKSSAATPDEESLKASGQRMMILLDILARG